MAQTRKEITTNLAERLCWQVIVLIDAATKIPLAVKVVPIQEHDTLSLRALVTQACTNLAGVARLHTVVFDRGFLAGTDLWWLDQRGLIVVVPAKEDMAAQAPPAELGQGDRVCQGLLRHLSHSRICPPAGGQAQRCASRHRHTSGGPGHIRTHIA